MDKRWEEMSDSGVDMKIGKQKNMGKEGRKKGKREGSLGEWQSERD